MGPRGRAYERGSRRGFLPVRQGTVHVKSWKNWLRNLEVLILEVLVGDLHADFFPAFRGRLKSDIPDLTLQTPGWGRDCCLCVCTLASPMGKEALFSPQLGSRPFGLGSESLSTASLSLLHLFIVWTRVQAPQSLSLNLITLNKSQNLDTRCWLPDIPKSVPCFPRKSPRDTYVYDCWSGVQWTGEIHLHLISSPLYHI